MKEKEKYKHNSRLHKASAILILRNIPINFQRNVEYFDYNHEFRVLQDIVPSGNPIMCYIIKVPFILRETFSVLKCFVYRYVHCNFLCLCSQK